MDLKFRQLLLHVLVLVLVPLGAHPLLRGGSARVPWGSGSNDSRVQSARRRLADGHS